MVNSKQAITWPNFHQNHMLSLDHCELTHWGRVTHICVSKLNTIASDNGLSPNRRQAIIWINAEILLIVPLGTNFSEILIEILTFSFKKMHLKRSSAKRRPFCLGLNELSQPWLKLTYCWVFFWQFLCHCLQWLLLWYSLYKDFISLQLKSWRNTHFICTKDNQNQIMSQIITALNH